MQRERATPKHATAMQPIAIELRGEGMLRLLAAIVMCCWRSRYPRDGRRPPGTCNEIR